MTGIITTGNNPKALWPGVRAWWGQKYDEIPQEWSQIFETKDSEKAYEEDVETTGFGLAPVKAQAGAVTYDSSAQGVIKRYTHVVYGLGFIVTEEEFADNLYKDKAFNRTEALAFSMRQTEEIVGANILNRAFNTSYTGGDAKAMIVSDHPTLDGTQSNVIATAADLSEASIEDLCIQIGLAKNSRGLRIKLMPKALIIPAQEMFNATRILKSTLQAGTANNDVNAIRAMNMFPDGIVVNHYLTDTDAWFIKTNAPNGLLRFNRRATAISKDNDFDTSNMKCKATTRFSVGWTDWRGCFGSPGA